VLSNTSNTQSDFNGVQLTLEGGQTVSYYLQDSLGTTRVMADSTGTLCYDADFYPFGGERPPYTDTCPQHYKFTGKERDSDNLDYYPARYGSSQLGRFMSPDPDGQEAANPAYPQTWNMYSYVSNNPLSMIDPTGTDGCTTDSHANGTSSMSCTQTVYVHAQLFQFNPIMFDLWQLQSIGQGALTAYQTLQKAHGEVQAWVNRHPGVQFLLIFGAMAEGDDPALGVRGDLIDSTDLIDPKAETHILSGDESGGGHRAGTGKSGKSEFPSGWSDVKILTEVIDVATDPASKVTTEGQTKVIEGTREGVDIRVIMREGRIRAAYPTNMPRNP
jgi:RHS repeat-associated protein